MLGLGVVLAGAGLLLVWVWRMRAGQIDRLEQLIRKARGIAGSVVTYRPFVDDDARDPAIAASRASLPDACTGLPEEMVVLGDFVELPEGLPPSGVVRWFRDPRGELFGFCAKLQSHRVAMLLTHTADATYMTRVAPVTGAMAARPPFANVQSVSPLIGLGAAIDMHRRWAAKDGCVVVTTTDELLAELARARARSIGWRTGQAPDELLDADLRSLLGKHYDTLGAKLAARLKAEMPRAKVV